MSPYLLSASVLFFVAGLLLGRHLWYVPEDVHRHSWSKWEDCPITVRPTWDGIPIGNPYDSNGQSRRCEGCGKSQIRKGSEG